jgi:hypothetical protein
MTTSAHRAVAPLPTAASPAAPMRAVPDSPAPPGRYLGAGPTADSSTGGRAHLAGPGGLRVVAIASPRVLGRARSRDGSTR